MANETDFLRFGAFSIKDLITRKLAEDTKYTDQIYSASNLAILIDIFSYIFQCLVMQLNTAAAESMFADTQIYENIVRLCKFIGYSPRGYRPAGMNINLYSNAALADSAGTVLDKYAFIDTGLKDTTGKNICFSTVKDYAIESSLTTSFGVVNLFMVNGKWKLHSTVFTASGTDYETFTLTGVGSDSASQQYVANEYIHIYVKDATTGLIDGSWVNDINGIFTSYSKSETASDTMKSTAYSNLYNKDDKVFTAYLNENHTYEIKFGNGVIGKKLNEGDQVFVMYLDTNGPDGQIDLSQINFNNIFLQHSAEDFNLSKAAYDAIFTTQEYRFIGKIDSSDYSLKPTGMNVSQPISEENVYDIKHNAPNWFKMGNRLITRSDYEYFIKNNPFTSTGLAEVIDVKCMNNAEYISTFYKWLYLMGAKHHANGRYYFNNEFWNRWEYRYADPADANNTYLWIKTFNDSNEKSDNYSAANVTAQLNNYLSPIKTLTTDVIAVKPVMVFFDICGCTDTTYIKRTYLSEQQSTFDEQCETYIEITMDNDAVYVSNTIQMQVVETITKGFNIYNCQLGQNVDFSDITNNILAIDGIKQIKTIFTAPDGSITSTNGLSFVSYSPILMSTSQDANDGYDDLEVGNVSRQLEQFQFPRFSGFENLPNRVKVITKTLTAVNTIKQ